MGLEERGVAPTKAAEGPTAAEAADTFAQRGFVTTQIDGLMNWARTGSLWPMTFGLGTMAIFLGILVVGFIYEWKKGALEWD